MFAPAKEGGPGFLVLATNRANSSLHFGVHLADLLLLLLLLYYLVSLSSRRLQRTALLLLLCYCCIV
jgi:hypothetical protein